MQEMDDSFGFFKENENFGDTEPSEKAKDRVHKLNKKIRINGIEKNITSTFRSDGKVYVVTTYKKPNGKYLNEIYIYDDGKLIIPKEDDPMKIFISNVQKNIDKYEEERGL